MKFWKKIFIYSMAMFLIIFNSAGVVIVENIHKRSLDRTIKQALDEHKSIQGTLYLNADSIQSMENPVGKQFNDWITLVVTGYVYNDKMEQTYLEIYDINNSIIFSNSELSLDITREEITEAKENERAFTIRNVQGRHYVFISSQFKIQETPVKMVLVKDIDLMYSERLQNYKIFIILDFFVFIILAAGMYFISKNVTRPIERLSEASKEIAQGNYTKRVKFKNSNAEVDILARHFNTMIQATEDTIDELKELNTAKQRFIDSLTHELKTPLTSIIGYSDLLLKSNVNENVRFKALNYINSEAIRLEKLSLTLLKLILIKQENINFTKLSLKHCLHAACKSLTYKIENKNLTLHYKVKDFTINGDEQLIMILLINLLDNAIKASAPSGLIEVEGCFSDTCNKYILSLRDYGMGIPEEDLDKIKEPFYMVDKARDRANSGTGLGLSICDEICSVHNIEFNISSKVNEGTSIILGFTGEGKARYEKNN